MWMKQLRSYSSGLGESVEDMKPQMPKRWRVVVVMLIAATVGALPSFAATDEVEQPVVLAPLDDIALFVDGAPRLVNLVGVFGNRLTDCVVESSDEGVMKVSLTGFKMLVTPVGVGDATITITASNSAGSVATTVSVGVGDRPPVAVGTLRDATLTVGDALEVDIAASFSGTNLVYSVMSSAEETAAATLSGTTVTLAALGAGEGSVTVTATNTAGSATQTFSVTVKDQPAVAVGTLADATLTVGDSVDVDIAAAFSGTNLVYSVTSSAEEIAAATLSGTTVTLAALVAGEGAVTVTAANSEGTATQTFSVTVKDQPAVAVGTLADATLTVGDSVDVDIAAAFSGTNLVYSVMSSAEEIAAATLSGTTVTLAALVAGEGSVTVTATNGEGTATQTFSVTVKDQPAVAVGTLADATLTAGDSVDVGISESFGGTNLVYSVTSSAQEVVAVMLSGTTVTLAALAAGEGSVTVTATNSEGTATQTFGVTVKDQPPAAVGTLADATLTVGDSVDLDIAASFSGSALVYAVTSSAEEVATATLSGTTVTLAALAAGEGSVTVTATNSEGTATQIFSVTVNDQPPVAVGTLVGATLTVGDSVDLDIAASFSGSALVYAVTSSAEEVATATLSGTTVTLAALVAGKGSVTVTANNSAGTATQMFAVTVENEHPAAVGTLSDATLTVGDALEVDIAAAFSGSALVYSVMSSSEGLASATLTSTVVTVSALAAGSVTVTVTAENSAGSATQMFLVSVEDQLPTTIGSLSDVRLTAGGESVSVEVAGSFGGTALVYSVAKSGGAVSVSLAGSQLAVVPLVEGEATVTVTATNSAGSATQTFRGIVSTDAAESSALGKGFAAIGASTLSSVSSAIGARFGDVRSAMQMPAAAGAWQGQRGTFGLAPDFARGNAYNGWDDGYGWGDGHGWGSIHGMPGLLPGTFAVPLNAAAGQDVKWQQPARWTIWGHSDRQSFEGAGYDGGLTSVYLGADADFGEAWLAGFAVSRSVGDADYEFTSARANGTGNIETEMLSIYPYVHWSMGDAAEMWAIVGVGWGDARHSRSATAQQGSADLSMRMASLGGRRTLASRDAWDLSLLGDASLLDLQTDGGVGIIDDMEVGISRVRAGLEAARNVALDGGGLLTWFGQVAARHDGGDGETGGGAELTGGFRYDSSGRLRLEAKARVLGMHAADDYEERGFSISAMVRPGPDGAGMSLSLASHSGAGMAGTGRSLVRGYGQPGDHALRGREDWSVDARLGYTILNHRLSALLTPFAEVDVAGDSRHAMMGVQYDFAGRGLFDRLDVELAGGRGYHHSRGASGNLVELRGEMRF